MAHRTCADTDLYVPQKVQPCSWNPKVPALLATGGGDSTCRIWDCPKTWKKAKGEGLLVKDNVVCKHSSAQRRADVAAVAWDVSDVMFAPKWKRS